MKNTLKFLTLLLSLISTKTIAIPFAGSDEYVNINETFNISDPKAIPGEVISLNKIQLHTTSSLDISSIESTCKGFWCTGGGIDLGYNGQAKYKIYITRMPVRVFDDKGNAYTATIAFSNKPIVLGVSEMNAMGGRKWYSTKTLSNVFNTQSENEEEYSSQFYWGKGYCGSLSGCYYKIAAYISSDSGMPYIYLKLPKNLSTNQISFNKVPVLKMQIDISNKKNAIVHSEAVYLYLSGKVQVPQRCYIKLNKDSFDFGTIYSNTKNGQVGQASVNLTTDCYYAQENTTQYLKIEAVSGGALIDNSMVYQIATDSDSHKALGVVFNINSASQCELSNKNKFNSEYLIHNIHYQQHYSTTDTVNFSLCKYGVPSLYGRKNITLRLTSRWVAP